MSVARMRNTYWVEYGHKEAPPVVNMALIAMLRHWSQVVLGTPVLFTIERAEGRNRVLLRVPDLGECEAAVLHRLHKHRTRLSSERMAERVRASFVCQTGQEGV